jgi:Fuc2NAc and GlcNAc transferase
VKNSIVFVSVAIAAFLVACIGTGFVRRHAVRNAIMDVPNLRSSHAVPTPRGGGLAIAITFGIALAFLVFTELLQLKIATVLIIAGGSVALAGYLDDRKALPASIRICVHIIAATIAVMVVGGIPEQAIRTIGLHGIWAANLVAIFVLTWSTNLFNFMDGIDGIAGSEAVFVASAGAALNWLTGGDIGLTAAMLMLAAATLGFLKWNWPPALIFMGDVGSGFLGFTLAVLAIAASRGNALPIEVWVILSGVFLVDATVTLLRRIVRGDRWFEAHRLHAYQRLANRWRSHLPVTILVIAINSFWLFPWALVSAIYPAYAEMYVVVALAPLAVVALLVGAGRNRI